MLFSLDSLSFGEKITSRSLVSLNSHRKPEQVFKWKVALLFKLPKHRPALHINFERLGCTNQHFLVATNK
jgi:hypothetical protein